MTASLEALQKISYIWYLIQFLNNLEIYTLLDFGSKVNIMTSIYEAKLGFIIQKINVGTQKIDGSTLKTYEIVIISF